MIDWFKYSYKVEGKKTSRRKKKYVNPSYNVEDLFRHFRQTQSDKKELMDIKQPIFKQIISEYNKVISDYIVKGHIVKLAFGLGELGVRKRKIRFNDESKKNIPVNPQFFGTGQKVFYLNEHSNYWQARFFWNKKHCRIENKGYYSFNACAINKQALSKVMKSLGGYLNYYEAKPYQPKK